MPIRAFQPFLYYDLNTSKTTSILAERTQNTILKAREHARFEAIVNSRFARYRTIARFRAGIHPRITLEVILHLS